MAFSFVGILLPYNGTAPGFISSPLERCKVDVGPTLLSAVSK